MKELFQTKYIDNVSDRVVRVFDNTSVLDWELTRDLEFDYYNEMTKNLKKRYIIQRGSEIYPVSSQHFIPWTLYSCHSHFCDMCWRETEFFSALNSSTNDILKKVKHYKDSNYIEKHIEEFLFKEQSDKQYCDDKKIEFHRKSTKLCSVHANKKNKNIYRTDLNYKSGFNKSLNILQKLLILELDEREDIVSIHDLRKFISEFRRKVYDNTRGRLGIELFILLDG